MVLIPLWYKTNCTFKKNKYSAIISPRKSFLVAPNYWKNFGRYWIWIRHVPKHWGFHIFLGETSISKLQNVIKLAWQPLFSKSWQRRVLGVPRFHEQIRWSLEIEVSPKKIRKPQCFGTCLIFQIEYLRNFSNS